MARQVLTGADIPADGGMSANAFADNLNLAAMRGG